MSKQLDARLLKAFHAVDFEDMPIIIDYVEFIAEKRSASNFRRGPMTLAVSNSSPLKISSSDTPRDPNNMLTLAL